jgi:hypothetical protein
MIDRSVPVSIAGNQLRFAFPASTLRIIAKRLGLSDLDEVLRRCYGLQPDPPGDGSEVDVQAWLMKINMEDFCEIAWAATLRHGGGEIFPSPHELGDAIYLGDIPDVLTRLVGALALSTSRWEASPDNPDPPKAAPVSVESPGP